MTTEQNFIDTLIVSEYDADRDRIRSHFLMVVRTTTKGKMENQYGVEISQEMLNKERALVSLEKGEIYNFYTSQGAIGEDKKHFQSIKNLGGGHWEYGPPLIKNEEHRKKLRDLQNRFLEASGMEGYDLGVITRDDLKKSIFPELEDTLENALAFFERNGSPVKERGEPAKIDLFS